MEAWMWLVLLYGVLKGLRDVVKKKALVRNSVIEVLFFYTLIGFIFVIPDIRGAFQMEMRFLPYIFIKSFKEICPEAEILLSTDVRREVIFWGVAGRADTVPRDEFVCDCVLFCCRRDVVPRDETLRDGDSDD